MGEFQDLVQISDQPIKRLNNLRITEISHKNIRYLCMKCPARSDYISTDEKQPMKSSALYIDIYIQGDRAI